MACLFLKNKLKMKNIADIHCHILPYVDDGAPIAEESQALVEAEYAAGVRTICCTPHLRRGMFETPDEVIKDQFEKLKERTRQAAFPEEIKLFLSREYHADRLLLERLEKDQILPLGNSKNLLLEFSNRHPLEDIHWFIKAVRDAGYSPLIAHAERYEILWESTDLAEELIGLGAKIQMNCSSLLGREGRRQASYCRKLLKKQLPFVIASDAHDTEYRPPELDKAADHLTRKFGEEAARKLLSEDPLNILGL